MRRRAFLRLAGLATALALPWRAKAANLYELDGSTTCLPWNSGEPVPSMTEYAEHASIIKVIGVGGAGCNAIEYMLRRGIGACETICCNSDAQSLCRSSATTKLQLGAGLSAGGNPEIAKQLALLQREHIADTLKGAHMVIITAGMGGGTGTGAAPVIADVARELGILTVALVITPFDFEGTRRTVANEGVIELGRHVDSLLVIPNDTLAAQFHEDTPMSEVFGSIDTAIHTTVRAMVDMITLPGLVAVDFEDVRTVLSGTGMAVTGSAVADGERRATLAAEAAVTNPLFGEINLPRAGSVLVNITASTTMGLRDYKDVMNVIRQYTAADATVICGAVFDETMEDALRVTLIATGFDRTST